MSRKKTPQIPEIRKAIFVKEYLKTKNATEATQRAYPNMKRHSANRYAVELMKNEDVQKEIEMSLRRQELTPEHLAEHTKEILEQGKQQLGQQTVTPELYSKTLFNVFSVYSKLGERVKLSQNLNINIDTASTPDLLRKRQEFNSFFNSVIDGETVK
jgi:hypothetical protein